MTIWILAILFVASSVGLGYRQGAIRAAIGFVGILFAAFLAVPIGGIFRALLPHIGFHNQAVVWAVSPLIGFVLVRILFEIGAFSVHRKIEWHYKYRVNDLQLTLWERLNHRLGACLGVLNGIAYFVLVSFVLFNVSYWTAPIAPSSDEKWTTRLVNKLGEDLQDTGVSKSADAVGTLPEMYYQMADLVGLLRQNPQLTTRLANYPPFISLAERDDIQQAGQDGGFTNAWYSGAPMSDLMATSPGQSLLNNQDLIHLVWGIVQTNYADLTNYLVTGQSAKYGADKFFGKWEFNPGTTVAMIVQARPTITTAEMKAARVWMAKAYAQTKLVVASDNQAFLENLPDVSKMQPNQPIPADTWKGTWAEDGTNYDLTLTSNGQNNKFMTAQTDGSRLTLMDGHQSYFFDRVEQF